MKLKRIFRNIFVTLLVIILGVFLIGEFNRQRIIEDDSDYDAPESLVLYSLDGTYKRGNPGQESPKTDEILHGFPVFGKVELTKLEQRKELFNALKRGMAAKGVPMAKCFYPRHAVQIVQDGKTIDYLVCFECNVVETYSNGVPVGSYETIHEKQQEVFNRLLKQYSIKLAPPAFE